MIGATGESNRRLHGDDQAQSCATRSPTITAASHITTARISTGRWRISIDLKLDPVTSPRWNNRGLTRHRKGNHAAPLPDFTEALRLDPRRSAPATDRPAAHEPRATIARRSTITRKPSVSTRKMPPSHNNRGLARHKAGDLCRAVADFTQALAIQSTFHRRPSQSRPGSSALQLYDRAIVDFSEAIRLDPNLPAYYHRAESHARKGNPAQAQLRPRRAWNSIPIWTIERPLSKETVMRRAGLNRSRLPVSVRRGRESAAAAETKTRIRLKGLMTRNPQGGPRQRLNPRPR